MTEQRPDFKEKLQTYFEGCQRITTWRDDIEESSWNLHWMKRWVRIEYGGGVHSFVDIATGEVLKPADFKTPAITKVKRGNIFDEFNGLQNIGPYGVLYSHQLKKFEPSEVWQMTETRKLDKFDGNEQAANDNICWHEGRDRCPKSHKGDHYMWYGRCRSGKRWFWSAGGYFWRDETGESDSHGWADTEEHALSAARDAIYSMAADRPAIAGRNEGYASETLKEINEAKRASRPPPDVSDSGAVEYLYDYWGSERYRVIKKTKERFYYVAQRLSYRWNAEEMTNEFIGWQDREPFRLRFTPKTKVFEKRGERSWRCFFLEPPPPQVERTRESTPDLRKLKAEMAAAHPDKGGTCDAFREAREKYVSARNQLCPTS